MKTLIFFIVILSFGCGKKSDSSKKSTQQESPIEVSTEDSDGDGVLDSEELKAGSDPLIADIPTFNGDFFKEMTVTLELYNKSNSTHNNLFWSVKNNKIKTSWSDKELEAPNGSIYHERLLKNYAANTLYKKNSFTFLDYNEGVFSHSSPALYEDSIFEISKLILASQKNGFEVNRAEVLLLANFMIKSAKFKFLRDPVFDIYYKSRSREGLIFIESKKIDGTYSFNDQNLVYVSFDTNNDKIIYDAILNGGSSLFIKLRDFVVYDNNQRYSEIISKVRTKSIPLTISIPGDQKTPGQSETIYVGSNGSSIGLEGILKRGLKNDVLMTSSSVDQVRDLSNRRRALGTTGENENLRWYIGTNGMSDNLYTYNFKINDGICLSYLSDKGHEKTPIYTARDFLTNSSNLIKTAKFPPDTKGVKIRIVPEVFLIPFQEEYRVIRADCGGSSSVTWDRNEVHYNIRKVSWKNNLALFFNEALGQYFVTLKNNSQTLLTGKLSDLIEQNMMYLSESSSESWADLTFSKAIVSDLDGGQTSLEIVIEFRPDERILLDGEKQEIKRDCKRSGIDGGGHGSGHIQTGIDSSLIDSTRYKSQGGGYSGAGKDEQHISVISNSGQGHGMVFNESEEISTGSNKMIIRSSARPFPTKISADFHIFAY